MAFSGICVAALMVFASCSTSSRLKELSEADLKRLEEIKKQQENAKELPTLFEDPAGAIVGGTVQSGKMMLRNMLSGQKMGVYGAGFGAIAGGLIGA